ncbi:hypothetical protein [Mammaliicoccus sp. G-M31]|uniref:hypothetical protein n=1 Tax=Mammaliicoccus sp. G-M31 TaxID=2898690 RepID=UPI001EFBD943|nr:hypothetical protein [Mammaliicoccus sp. G-M31]
MVKPIIEDGLNKYLIAYIKVEKNKNISQKDIEEHLKNFFNDIHIPRHIHICNESLETIDGKHLRRRIQE